jgi:hypothetical protein
MFLFKSFNLGRYTYVSFYPCVNFSIAVYICSVAEKMRSGDISESISQATRTLQTNWGRLTSFLEFIVSKSHIFGIYFYCDSNFLVRVLEETFFKSTTETNIIATPLWQHLIVFKTLNIVRNHRMGKNWTKYLN